MQNNIKYLNFDILESTNKWAKENAHTFSNKCIYAVSSNVQTHGYGSNNRSWESSKGGMYLTICIPVYKQISNLNTITIISALSIIDSFKKYNIDIYIKWPNDLIINNKKIGGILSETIFANSQQWLLIGIGINFNNNNVTNLTRPLFQPSTVNLETNITIDINKYIKHLVPIFINKYHIWINNSLTYFMNDFYNNNILKNKNIKISVNGKIYEGKFHSISDEGQLNIIKDGSIHKYINGDIVSIK